MNKSPSSVNQHLVRHLILNISLSLYIYLYSTVQETNLKIYFNLKEKNLKCKNFENSKLFLK